MEGIRVNVINESGQNKNKAMSQGSTPMRMREREGIKLVKR